MVDQVLADKFAEELGFSGYGGHFKVGKHNMVMTCDGVGTKLFIAETLGIFDTVGIDLVAMNANDLLCCGATPLTFMDYYATGQLDLKKSHQILQGINTGCREAQCELVGGETAQLRPMFANDHWFDLAGFMVGEIQQSFSNVPIKAGDVLVGIPSSGIHSNGYTQLRKGYFQSQYEEWMLEPTRIYRVEILNNMHLIKSCAHITGGGVHGNVPRALPDTRNYMWSAALDDFWVEIKNRLCMSQHEMLNTFNCGYGMVMVVDEYDVEKLDIDDAVVVGAVF